MQQHNIWIHNLLDGELNAHDEPSLFGELSVNADLRTEFKQQLAIRSAVQQDRMALVPPAHLTTTVFSGLGFASPLAGAAAGAAGGGFLVPWLMKLGMPILAAAAAVGVTMAVSNAPNNQNAQNIQNNQNALNNQNFASTQNATIAATTSSTSATSSSAATASDAESMLASLRNENRGLRSALASARVAAASRRNSEAPRPTPPTPAVSEPPTEPVVPVMSSIDLTNTMAFDRSRDLQLIETQIMPATMVYTPYPSAMVQVRGFATSALTDVSVSEQNSWYQNVAIAALYQISPQHIIGVEGGSESFAQVFEGNRDGQTIRYEQRPSTMWAGVLYRYTFGSIAKTAFSPYTQVFAGGTQYGPLGRLTVGVQYSPAEPLSFILGAEGSVLGYKFQDAWFTSTKIGLTYGLALRL